MVIVDPEGVIFVDDFQNSIAKNTVYPDIIKPENLLVFYIRGEVVKKRPNGLITEAVIKILHLGFREENGPAMMLLEAFDQGVPAFR